MGEIKSSGSARVVLSSDSSPGTFGPWTAMFMGVDQATHGLTFDATWGILVMGSDDPTGGNVGRRLDLELGIGPTSPPAETFFGPMRWATLSAGGGRGNSNNFSFPLRPSLSAGDRVWGRVKSDLAGINDMIVYFTVTDQFQPIRPATKHFSTGHITAVVNPTGVLFGGGNVLGLWHIMGRNGVGDGMPLPFDASWMSLCYNLVGLATTNARFQIGASRDGNPPDLPEVIDLGFQSIGGGGSHVQVTGDVLNMPIPYEDGDTVWIRGAMQAADPSRIFTMTANFWGN